MYEWTVQTSLIVDDKSVEGCVSATVPDTVTDRTKDSNSVLFC